jgi:hypothetical protein
MAAPAPAATQVQLQTMAELPALTEDEANRQTAGAEQEEEPIKERGQVGRGGQQASQGSSREATGAAQAAAGFVHKVTECVAALEQPLGITRLAGRTLCQHEVCGGILRLCQPHVR